MSDPNAYCCPLDLATIERILVVKIDSISDWVLCTPFLKQLRAQAPRAAITAVVSEPVYSLAVACPYLDSVVALQQHDAGLRFMAADTVTVSAFLADYCTGRFGLAIVPRWDVDDAGAGQIAAASGAPHVIGFSERCTARKQRLGAGADRFYTRVVDRREPRHEAEQSLHLLEALGGQPAPVERPRVDTLPIDELAVGSFLRRTLGRAARPLLAVAPFASEAKRALPPERLVPLCERLMRTLDVQLVILGATSDASAADELARQLGPAAISGSGRLTLRQSAALIRRCMALVGADSGPAHIAAAVETPVAVLSCHPAGGDPVHENAPQRFAPRGDPARVLVLQPPQAMAPCTTACDAAEPHCILALPPALVARQVEGFIQAQLAGDPASRTLRP